ncbi:DUF2194 domain-containing protein [Pontibacillus salipaludis]|uniref:DUF2194 domain-containing protein n=1 Tax=Pontibacillus salipaludis TaxID=1697394 RepID=UPI0031EA05F9
MRNIRSTFAAIILVLLLSVVVLQGGRVTAIYSMFPLLNQEEKHFTTMGTEVKERNGEPITISLLENDSIDSKAAISNIRYALQYAKIPFREIKKEDLSSLEPSPYHILIVAGEHAKEWPYEVIESFVDQGGRLMVALRYGGVKQAWNDLVGIDDANDFIQSTQKGLTFEKSLFPGYPNLSSENALFSHSVLDITLKEEADLYLSVQDHPIMWTFDYGKGKVGYWNTTITKDKEARGLVLQSLSLLPPTFVMHQSGIKVSYLDDFPSPIKEGVVENMGYREFVKDVWWESVEELRETYDLIYTGALIGTYEDRQRLGAEELIERREFPMVYYGRQILNRGGELALHGYNHQPLVVEEDEIPVDEGHEYVPWKRKSIMKKKLNHTEELFHHYFPDQAFQSYVPPSNILGPTGLDALMESLPSVNVIASLYFGAEEGESFIQEFDFDQTYAGLYHFPRTASGHGDTSEDYFLLTDAIANQGVFSHFIHPDDRTDVDRAKGRNWNEMREGLEGMYRFLSTYYPYLESLTQQEAREKLIAYQQSNIDVRYEKDAITISGEDMLHPSIALVRLNSGQHLETGAFSFGEVEVMPDSSNLYIVTLREPSVTLKMKEEVS